MSLILYNSADQESKNKIKTKYGLTDLHLSYPLFVPNKDTIICDTKVLVDDIVLNRLSKCFNIERISSEEATDVCVGDDDDDKPLNFKLSTITITYGDVAENHAGMEKIGNMADSGLTMDELRETQKRLKERGIDSDLILLPPPQDLIDDFNEFIETRRDKEKKELRAINLEAGVLYIPGGVSKLLEKYGSISDGHKAMFNEQAKLKLDKKAFMKGRTVNKVARWNLCFDDTGHGPSADYKEGTVVEFHKVPLTRELRTIIPKVFGPKTDRLKAEGNYYYNVNKCYIGYHGDGERRIIVAARLGQPMYVYYQWYFNGKAYGKHFKINIDGGDMYAMSDKAAGTDWKKKIIPTLRHAAAREHSLVAK